MSRYRYISTGSNTTVKSGAGQLYGINAAGADGDTVFAVDSISIGVTPNYVTQPSNSSNLAAMPLTAAPLAIPTYGVPFNIGLTVAATSSSLLTVFYD